MRIRIWMLAVAPFALIGCADEPPVTTTTTVTREVTTTGPAVATAPVASDVYVEQTPPVVRVETQTVSPGPGYIWTPGYWRWSGTGYVWVSGAWVRPPRVTAVWVPGHWVHRARGWVYIPGHWR
jgi:WXXGXW repeat (2 copies)